MRDPLPREISGDGPSMGLLGDAVWRLDQALGRLEGSFAGRARSTGHDTAMAAAQDQAESDRAALLQAASLQSALERDKADLAAELEVSRQRELELMDAAAAASDALGRAGAEVRSALGLNIDLSEEEAA